MATKVPVVKPRRKNKDEDPRIDKAVVILKRMFGSFRGRHSKAS